VSELRVAVIPGDGIGPEVTDASLPVVEAVAARHGIRLRVEPLDWGGERHLRTGQAFPADAAAVLAGFDAVLFGAVGRPDIPDTELIFGSIIRLRQELGLRVNLRPVRTFPGVPRPLSDPADIDLLIVRENTEGEYVGVGGSAHSGSPAESALEVAVHTKLAIEETARVAFEAAEGRRRSVTLVTKSNALRHGYGLWDRVVGQVAAGFPRVDYRVMLVDAMAARLVERPADYDVLVCSNLFGDILSDLAAAICGGLGIAPSANVRPGSRPGIFEPVHGSAPDIAGQGVADPVAYLLSAALMFDHVETPEAAATIRAAVAAALREPACRTPDLGGTASTKDLAEAVLANLGSGQAIPGEVR
jgi:tartrate dehydrogenase/decarboxylase/D-malate dehydrogenase